MKLSFFIFLPVLFGQAAMACYEPNVARKAVRALHEVDGTPTNYVFWGHVETPKVGLTKVLLQARYPEHMDTYTVYINSECTVISVRLTGKDKKIPETK